MRKLIAFELVSLDGVVGAPDEWAFSYSDEEMDKEVAAGMDVSDALLLGRATYEEFASFWPNQPGGTQMVDYINSVRKYVVSTTLQEPLEWNNSTLIQDDVAEKIAILKEQPGKYITITGSITLVQSLLKARLLDELQLMVHPVVLGGGRRLFESGGDQEVLELVDSKTFNSGVVSLTYRPSSG
ncbi:MAG: dihydrofolate reductase family protein [Rubrobacteraceae bacterium]|nr:dihydrofolate reductase family protein [Rubrobacteraceae bacterium]